MENSKKALIILLSISALVRAFLAGWIELGTDEAYYWTYALYPDWSHFDHPGMVGWVIQLFTLNLYFDSEFFIRLASLVFMTVNTWLMFRIGKELKDDITGLYAAMLFTASIYGFAITGIFILPDTPLMLFWLLATWMFIRYLKQQKNKQLLLAGFFIGLAMLSKYTGAVLWTGFLLYVLFFDRKTLKNPFLYLSLFITALCCIPVFFWNIQNDFISFKFHEERVDLFSTPNLFSFGNELGGEFFYNNPVNFVIAIIAVVAAFRKKLSLNLKIQRLLLITALPMIGLFLLFSLNRETLPHWSAPAFCLLIPLTAYWLQETTTSKAQRSILTGSLTALLLSLVVCVAQVKTGFVPLDQNTDERMIGRHDISLDVYGWRQVGEKFAALRAEKIAIGEMNEEDALIGNNWFPTASFDYYVSRPLGMKTLGLGLLKNIHKYQWINKENGGFEKGANYWYLADSHYFIDPQKAYSYTNFKEIRLAGIIPIERNGKVARNIFVYECRGMVYVPKALQLDQNKTTK